MPWTFLLDRAALTAFNELGKRERTKLVQAFEHLANYPDNADIEWTEDGFRYHEKSLDHGSSPIG